MPTTRLMIVMLLSAAVIASVVVAEEATQNAGFDTPEQAFAAYKQATNDRDWKRLFSLGTAALQDNKILDIAVNAAVSKDATLRALVKKHGVDWEPFDRDWTEAEDKRFREERPTIATRVGSRAQNKADLYAAARDYADKANGGSSIAVREMRNLVTNGSTASGESIETITFMATTTDNLTKTTRRIPMQGNGTITLHFCRIGGKWRLAIGDEAIHSP